MYTVDERDQVVELDNAPQSDVGAPLPLVLADDLNVVLVYIISEVDPHWDGTYVQVVSPDSEGVGLAVIKFLFPYAHLFGPPNDEAFSGHPLADRGLHPYGAFQVVNSSWIRRLERMNSVHPDHKLEEFEKLKHYIFTFHDSTFECAARDLQVATRRGSLRSIFSELPQFLWR